MHQNRKGIQFNYRDTWSLDYTLSPIILSALLKFREYSKDRKGIPGVLLCDLYPDSGGEYSDEQLNMADKMWDAIVDKMIYAFDLKNEPKMKDYRFKFGRLSFEEQNQEDLEKGVHRMSPITVTNEDEYQRYKDDEKLHWDKVKEGHMLFGQYLSSLWH